MLHIDIHDATYILTVYLFVSSLFIQVNHEEHVINEDLFQEQMYHTPVIIAWLVLITKEVNAK